MEGLSKKEIQVVSDLEFRKMYYFTTADIRSHFKNKRQVINTIYTLRKKGRIIKISKSKYFLIPIKARTGKWTDNTLIVTDEMFNGKDYYVGGWYAAHYWKLTDQIPAQIDIYTTKRQGKIKIFNMRFVFHRTTAKNVEKMSIIQKTEGHSFRIIRKESAVEWMKLRR